MLRTRLIALLTVTALAASTAACGGSDDSSKDNSSSGKPDAVKVGVIPIVDVAPIYLGKAKGFFQKQNIDLTMELAQGGAAIVPAVVSGQYQFGFSNVVSLLLGASKNVPIKVVANGNNATADPTKDFSALLVKDPAITRPKDLEGKTVAANTLKNIVATSVNELVRKDGGDPSKVKYAEVAFPDQAAALDGGRVQAIFLVEPFVSSVKSKGWKQLGSFAAVSPNMMIADYFTSAQLLGEKPDLAKRFTAALKESLAYADAHPDEVRQIVTTYTTIKADAAAAITLPKYNPEIDKASVDLMNNLMVKDGLLTAPVDTSKLLQ
ncbi:ABC transporter substrate-binding protein [Actinoplanes sp. KI2]|uniref:ABC transporter substrate-binding protein n=1 Tax=Actinoplanes sp. KI2 TaxID=2983315 RepID=UPI0021D58198|nr:ABC transporter substrate-binding protein [Actinoplanes sp. KI2]MCU7728208.1 ABC transporter substrate-binding protein [Actinoplanes sp. KI2]